MTSFTSKVYKTVLSIPMGQTRTYRWVAKRIGHPRAYRAVGQVLKKNPYPLIIPCHRVVGSNGSLGGYSFGGGKRKKLLIDLERKISEMMV